MTVILSVSNLFDLRACNTLTGHEAERWVHQIFSHVPEGMNRYFRADSGYGKNSIYESLVNARAKFAIVLKENIGKYVRRKNKNLLMWKSTKIKFFNSDECEMSMGLYPIKSAGQLRVVFIRVKKTIEEINAQLDLLKAYDPEEDDYKYYSIITNIDISEKNNEEIIEFYRGRANCENFIREQKYGFDFLNFPCKKFVANQIWGLIGTLAHNMTRYFSYVMEQKKKRVRGKDGTVKTIIQQGYFSKKVRNSLIKIPCQMVRTARTIKLKLNNQSKEVLEKIMKDIQLTFSAGVKLLV